MSEPTTTADPIPDPAALDDPLAPGTLADVAVIGAGAMGTGIVQVAAAAGHLVHLVDARPGVARQARDQLVATLDRLAARGRIEAAEAATTAERVLVGPSADGDLVALPQVGLVIEAVVEDLAVKRQIFARLAAHQPATTVLASNTSSLDITAIAEGLPAAERVIGLHFFNPPPLMRLVEVVRGQHSSARVLEAAADLMRRWGKTPVACSSTPGFIVNRVARPFYGEAQRMLADGVADAATLDYALREFGGFRMGPLELTDLIGQDVNLAVGTSVWEQTGRDPRYAPTAQQQELVAAGHLGRKTGRGVYRYTEQGEAVDASPDLDLADRLVGGPILTDPVARTIAMLVNEAVDLVHRAEASAQDVDTAMRLGTNYPRGPHEWLASIGAEQIRGQLHQLDAAYPGGRYRISPGLPD